VGDALKDDAHGIFLIMHDWRTILPSSGLRRL
jgi:hypothetical protein